MTLERIGPYRVVRKLGEGGMGAVLEAIQEPIGRRVAVKILHPKYAQEPAITARFFNEARAVNIIDHPGIVQVSDYGQLPDGTAYLVMEFLKGETLNQRAKRGGLGLPDIVRMARQIASALAAAHEKNVFHRDLKPDNIMIVPDHDAETPGRERVKLLDFGIAKVASADEVSADGKGPKTATDVVMGTPRYMAPEQCRGGVAIDGKADVYSMGVLLFELLAGRPPFIGASGEVLAMHIYEQPPSLRELAPHVPDELTNLVHRLLAKKKEDRPTMAEVQTSLEQLSLRHPTSVLQAIKWTPGMQPPSTPSGSNPLQTPVSAVSIPQASTLGMSTGQREVVLAKQSSRRLLLGIGGGVVLFGLAFGIWRMAHTPSPPTVVPTPVAQPPKSLEGIVVDKLPQKPPEPRKVHLSVTTTPPGAQVLRASDGKLLGVTPWNSDEDAAQDTLDVKLHLGGYVDKVVHLGLAADTSHSETLEPAKKPWRPGLGPGRPGVGKPGTGKPNSNGKNPSKDEQPRIVD